MRRLAKEVKRRLEGAFNPIPYNYHIFAVAKICGVVPVIGLSRRLVLLDKLVKVAWLLIVTYFCFMIVEIPIYNPHNYNGITLCIQVLAHFATAWINQVLIIGALREKSDYKYLLRKMREVDGLLIGRHCNGNTFPIIIGSALCFGMVKVSLKYITYQFVPRRVHFYLLQDILDLNIFVAICMMYIFMQAAYMRCIMLNDLLLSANHMLRVRFVNMESVLFKGARSLQVYTIMMDFMRQFNKVFGKAMFFIYCRITLYSLDCISNALWYSLKDPGQVFKNKQLLLITIAIIESTVSVLKCTMILTTMKRLQKEMQKMLISIHRLSFWLRFKDYTKELQPLEVAIARRPLTFSAAGFLKVDYSMLYSMLTTIIVYSIVILNFDLKD